MIATADHPTAMIAYCHRCQRDTETVILPLSSGHYGNCCSECRATRKGRPFVSRAVYEETITTNAQMGRGPNHDRKK